MSDNRRRVAFFSLALLALSTSITACSKTKKNDCASPEVFCVGLVTDVGKVDDKSFNQSAWDGVVKAQKELGATTQYIETTDPKDYGKNIATFAEEKYDIVVTVGFALSESTRAAAEQFPETKFIGVDQFGAPGTDRKNLIPLSFPEDKAGFLVGALAALMTKTGKIGAVLATDSVPACWRYGEGFRAGAKHVKPGVELNIVYHNDVGIDKTFSDPEWGKTTAISMIDKGVDIVFGGGGKTGNGALIGASAKGAYAIGVDTDQYLTVPEAQKSMLTSAIKFLDQSVFDLLKLAKDGKLTGGNVIGKGGHAPYHELDSQVPASVRAKMEELEKGLSDGAIKTQVASTKL